MILLLSNGSAQPSNQIDRRQPLFPWSLYSFSTATAGIDFLFPQKEEEVSLLNLSSGGKRNVDSTPSKDCFCVPICPQNLPFPRYTISEASYFPFSTRVLPLPYLSFPNRSAFTFFSSPSLVIGTFSSFKSALYTTHSLLFPFSLPCPFSLSIWDGQILVLLFPSTLHAGSSHERRTF